MAREPAPLGTVRVARPTIAWGVWPADEETRVTSVALSLNGAPVGAAYVAGERRVVYAPTQALAPGRYAARCRVTFNGTWPVEKTWEFVVACDAAPEVAAPNEQQQAALARANAYRRTLGLPDFTLDAGLCASATAHARYMNRPGRFGHAEQAGEPGYSGDDPAARNAAFGWAGGGCYETVSLGHTSARAAVAGLFDAPYHRIAFLQPGAPAFGAGFAGPACALEFGLAASHEPAADPATVVYPAPGQSNVPLAWDANELPNPLRLHANAAGTATIKNGAPVGYVITYACFGAGAAPARGDDENAPSTSRLRVAEATLTLADTGAAVPVWVNTPENDEHLDNAVFVIPRQPLRPGTTYRVNIAATTEAGQDVSRTWTFTTAPRENAAATPGRLASGAL